MRRYVERALRLGEETLAGLADRDAVEVLATWGYHAQAYRDCLAYYSSVQLRYRADGVVIDGIRLVLDGDLVVRLAKTASSQRNGIHRQPVQNKLGYG
ncbi:hypothetical protein [Methylorubrum thiocyanatum]|uniref:hypothetical protein n=1 Tax=Methylorubrum thiocyanatum TaxID=47958 RepID=UPI003F7F8BE9